MTTEVVIPRRTALGKVRYVAVRALWMEVGGWLSIFRFVFRRPRVPSGAAGFAYHQEVLPLFIVFIAVSLIEIVVVDLAVHPWPSVRIPLLVVGIWGLTWMLGMLFGFLTRPHAVGPEGIHIRQGSEVDIFVPWQSFDAFAVRKDESSAPRLTREADGVVLRLRVQSGTNLEIELFEPAEVRLPQGRVILRRIRFHADSPTDFLKAVRQNLP